MRLTLKQDHGLTILLDGEPIGANQIVELHAVTILGDDGVLKGSTTGPGKIKTVTVPAITDGENSNVVCFTDASFIGMEGVVMSPTNTPPDNMVIAAVWVSNPGTGEVTARFAAVGDNILEEAQDFLFVGFRGD